MNTITIQSPAELRGAYLEELADAGITDLFVSFECVNEKDRWGIVAWFPKAERCRGNGTSPEEALAALKAEIAKRKDPLENLRADAALLGMKLVPA